jgi:hypothetical protein
MAVPVRERQKTAAIGDSGELRAMPVHKRCRYAACQELGITAVGDEDLCCDHFVLRCYEFLEQIDAERAKNGTDMFHSANLRSAVNGCLQGALEVSLKSDTLDNLQKARLLDIMLWAGEYVHRADAHRAGGTGYAAAKLRSNEIGQRALYQMPRIKTRTSFFPQ